VLTLNSITMLTDHKAAAAAADDDEKKKGRELK